MWTALASFVGSMFSSDKVGDTVLDLVRDKTGLNELSEEKRIQLAIEYEQASKHKSPMRRFLAFIVGCLFFLFVLGWFIAMVSGTAFEVTQATLVANRIVTFFNTVLKDIVMLTFAFYFGMGAVNSFRSGHKGNK